MKPDRLRKAEALQHWHGLTVAAEIPMQPIIRGKTGSNYNEDGIRITGSRAFIDSVLSRLQDLLILESPNTRLAINYQQATDRETGQPMPSWCCYVQVHQRGRDAVGVNSMMPGREYVEDLERLAEHKPRTVYKAISAGY